MAGNNDQARDGEQAASSGESSSSDSSEDSSSDEEEEEEGQVCVRSCIEKDASSKVPIC